MGSRMLSGICEAVWSLTSTNSRGGSCVCRQCRVSSLRTLDVKAICLPPHKRHVSFRCMLITMSTSQHKASCLFIHSVHDFSSLSERTFVSTKNKYYQQNPFCLPAPLWRCRALMVLCQFARHNRLEIEYFFLIFGIIITKRLTYVNGVGQFSAVEKKFVDRNVDMPVEDLDNKTLVT